MKTRVGVLAAGIAMLVTACGGGGATASGVWARPTADGAVNGAVYMTLTSNEDDQLLRVIVAPAIAAKSEIHQTVMADTTATTMDMSSDTTMHDMSSMSPDPTMDMSSDTTMQDMSDMGAMTMVPVDAVPIPKGETVKFEPGGYHVMLFNVKNPLKVGDTFDITLVFEKAGEKDVTVEVRDSAP
jgi:copper(I)-binding protein